MLVDGASKVVFANTAARALLNSAGGLALEAGCLRSTDGSDALLRELVVSCKRNARTRNGPGGGISIRTGPRRSLRVTVTPLRVKGTVAELPWLGLQIPVAMVTISAPLDGKITELTGGMSFAAERMQIAQHGFHPLVEHMGIDLRR